MAEIDPDKQTRIPDSLVKCQAHLRISTKSGYIKKRGGEADIYCRQLENGYCYFVRRYKMVSTCIDRRRIMWGRSFKPRRAY